MSCGRTHVAALLLADLAVPSQLLQSPVKCLCVSCALVTLCGRVLLLEPQRWRWQRDHCTHLLFILFASALALPASAFGILGGLARVDGRRECA